MAKNVYFLRDLCPDADSLRLPRVLGGVPGSPAAPAGYRVHILALGDVGATLLLGLKVLGGGLIHTIGIWDMDEKMVARYEMEMGQMGWAFPVQEPEAAMGAGDAAIGQTAGSDACQGAGDVRRQGAGDASRQTAGGPPVGMERILPDVVPVRREDLFRCDLFLFCASKAVPAVGVRGDVRMMQLAANKPLVEQYAREAKAAGITGIVGVVSDPVDPLCKAALLAGGFAPGQVRGFGLGVMHRRALYFAGRDGRFSRYGTEGRAFGPHGGDLVIADSIEHYDEELSLALTRQTVEANLAVRALGFKPYLAPAISSGAMSVVDLLAGRWHYSSVYVGHGADGAFLGQRNRLRGAETETEAGTLPLPAALYRRIETAYTNLKAL